MSNTATDPAAPTPAPPAFPATQGGFQRPLLETLAEMGPDKAHLIKTVQAKLIAKAAPVADEKKAVTAIGNAVWTLKQRGCMVAEGHSWRLTAVGLLVVEGADLPPLPPYKPGGNAGASTAATPAPAAAPPAPAAAPAVAPLPRPSVAEAMASAASNENPRPAVEAPEAAPEKATEEAPPAPPANPGADPAPEATPLPSTAPEQAATAPAATATPKPAFVKRGLPVAPAEWVEDPYLRGLVTANHACFGSWIPNDPACKGCVVAGHCRNGQAAALSMLSARLKTEAEVAASTKNLHAAVAGALNPETKRDAAALVHGQRLRASYDLVCARTGQAIARGEFAIYLRGEGAVKEDAVPGPA